MQYKEHLSLNKFVFHTCVIHILQVFIYNIQTAFSIFITRRVKMNKSHRKRKKLYLDPTYDRRLLSISTRRKWNKIRNAVLPRILLNVNKEGNTFHSIQISYAYMKNVCKHRITCLFFLNLA